MLVVLLLSLFCLTFGAAVTTSLLLKEITFRGLLHFLDTLAVTTTIFIQFDVVVLDLLDVLIATFLQLLTL
jgi:hypothetical protein